MVVYFVGGKQFIKLIEEWLVSVIKEFVVEFKICCKLGYGFFR